MIELKEVILYLQSNHWLLNSIRLQKCNDFLFTVSYFDKFAKDGFE